MKQLLKNYAWLLIALFFSYESMANIYCSQVLLEKNPEVVRSSVKIAEDNILSCGVGVDFDENTAKKIARDDSLRRIQSACFNNGFCQYNESSVKLKELSCIKQFNDKYKCYLVTQFFFDFDFSIIYLAALFMIGLSTFYMANIIFLDDDKQRANFQLDEAKETSSDVGNDIILKYTKPFFKRYFTPTVAGLKQKNKIREKYKQKLANAGLTKILTPDDFFAFKLCLIFVFPVLFLGIRTFLEETWPLTYVPIIALIGFYYPNIWLGSKIQTRRRNIMSSMPFVIDMLALSVEAGLDFVAAMTKVIEKAPPGPLSEEFEGLIKEIRIGASRAEALRNMAWRIDMLPISSFCATLIAADSVGASIGPILKSQSIEIREKRSSDLEKEGEKAANKILFPMLFLIVPAVMFIMAAPFLVEFISG